MNIEELYERLASGPREEALTLGVKGHDERANRARAELADALLAEKDRNYWFRTRVFALEMVAAARGDLQMVVNDPERRWDLLMEIEQDMFPAAPVEPTTPSLEAEAEFKRLKAAVVADAPWPKWARQELETLRGRLEPLLPNSELTPEYDDAADKVALVTREGDGLIATFDPVWMAVQFYGYKIAGKENQVLSQSLDEAVKEFQDEWRQVDGNLTVYTLDHCPACQMTRRQFDKAGLTYMVVDLADAEPERAEFVEQGIRQAPVVEVAGKEPYGGFNPGKIKDIIATFPPIDEAAPTVGRAGSGHRPRATQHDQVQARGRGR